MSMTFPCTPLMCVEVTAIVPPRQQALLRTAGSVGAAAYTEVVAQGRSTMHLEYTAPEGEECGPHVPVVLPFTTTDENPFDARSAVLVVSNDYLVANTPTSALDHLSVHTGVTRVRYVAGACVKSVGHGSFNQGPTAVGDWVRGVTSIELCGFEGVASLGDQFMHCCSSLLTIDLSPLGNLTSIGTLFMYNCASLTVLDLAPLSNITHIEHAFMMDCVSLRSIDLSPLRNVTNIGNRFMYNCSALTAIDVSPLSKVTMIGHAFLGCTSSLTAAVSFSFFDVTNIGSNFMCRCTSLTQIDLTSFSSVNFIGPSFLYGCSALKTIDMCGLSSLTDLTGYFMANCTSLTSINLSGLVSVNTIYSSFMSGCTSLETIDLRPLSRNVTSVGTEFLGQCGTVKILHKKDIGPVLTEALPTSKTSWSGCTMA